LTTAIAGGGVVCGSDRGNVLANDVFSFVDTNDKDDSGDDDTNESAKGFV